MKEFIKNMNRFIYTFILLFFTSVLHAQEYSSQWGISQTDFMRTIPPSAEFYTLKPDEVPDSNNRIITFFKTMSGEGITIDILRIKGQPVKDYCFFNNRLYSVTEEWNYISFRNADKLINAFGSTYTSIGKEQKDGVTIYSFTKDKTKIIIYRKPVDSSYEKIKILFYTNDVFNILLKE